MSRQPGERTKIAVSSKNDKVDSVGACVGMRGSRVRNIVNELQGEKIDIVRYSDDIREYIKAALSPAEVSEIKIFKEHMKADVIVNDDQLSLAIGKHGQNVRLASQLVGWELDIRTKDTAGVAKEKLKSEAILPTETAAPAVQQETQGLEKLPGVGEKTLDLLREAGFNTIEDIAKAEVKDLTSIKGIGEKAQKLIEAAREAK